MKEVSIPSPLRRIIDAIPSTYPLYLVGGCVRDAILGLENKDYDIEVFGINYAAMAELLSRFGKVDLVGKSFGVIKLRVEQYLFDFSIPRRDSKIDKGHQGFSIEFDPNIRPEEAAARRDYTINSMMHEPRTGHTIDFFGGLDDLDRRILRHTGPAFVEDPLRVLRGMQFAARFDLVAAAETIELCRQIRPAAEEISRERVREEWFKWAARGGRPSAGLRFLDATGWIGLYPALEALKRTPQDPEWHPEGDVFVHTGHCCDALVLLPEWQASDETSRIVLSLATLCHDFGKPATTHEAEREGKVRIVSPGHEEAGGPISEAFLESIGTPIAVVERVIPLVKNHLAHLQNEFSDRAVRRLARRLAPEKIENLCIVIAADHMGRPPKPKVMPEGALLLRERARSLDLADKAPRAILLGRHLLALGLTPGPHLGPILNGAFEAQIEGEFSDLAGALEWVAANHPETGSPPATRN